MQDVLRRGWSQTIVYRTRTVRSIASSQQTKRNNWPLQPKERERSTRRRKASPPPLYIHLMLLFCGRLRAGRVTRVTEAKIHLPRRKSFQKKSFKACKTTDFKDDLKSVNDKWSEQYTQLEAMFLAIRFTVLVEPVQKTDVVVTESPFIPPVHKTTVATGQI